MISAWYYIVCACLLGLSAFFSSAEMAYSSANRLRLESAMENGSNKAKVAFAVCSRYDDALSAILIGNNLVNNGLSSLAAVIVILLVGEQYTPIATNYSDRARHHILRDNAKNHSQEKRQPHRNRLRLYHTRTHLDFKTYRICHRREFVRLITKPLHGEAPDDSQEAAVEELVSIIETVEDEGVIDEDRSELLQAALDFSEISASEVMTSRVDIVAIDIDDDWGNILKTIDSAPYSRLPVYENSLDNIIGVLYLNHFLKALVEEETVEIRSLLMEPCYVYKTLKLPSVLGEMRKQKKHLAIVTD